MGSLLNRARELARNPQLIRNSSADENLELARFSANPQNPQPVQDKKNIGGTQVIHPNVEQWERPTHSVALAHNSPEWLEARDKWHAHYFDCPTCIRHGRQIRRPFKPNPCEEGRRLNAIYDDACDRIYD